MHPTVDILDITRGIHHRAFMIKFKRRNNVTNNAEDTTKPNIDRELIGMIRYSAFILNQ